MWEDLQVPPQPDDQSRVTLDPDERAPFETVSSQDLLSTYHFTVRRLVLQDGDERFERDIEVHDGSAAVLPVGSDGTITLVWQFRIPLGRWTLELPTGGIDGDETMLEAAARELAEETGLVAADLVELCRFANSPGHSTQWTHVYLATGAVQGEMRPEGPEERVASLRTLSLAEALSLVDSGGIVDAKTVLGLLTFARRTGA